MQPNPIAIALVLLATATGLDAQRGVRIADGIEVTFKPPSRWTYLGANGDRGSLRAMFCAPRSFAPKAGRRGEHTPTMRVLWLDAARVKEAAARKSDWPLRTPYSNARDYIDRSHGKGAAIKNVEETTFDGKKGVIYEVQYPREHGDLTIHLASVPLDGGELLVEFELITEQYKRQRGSFTKALKTLSFTPKDKIKALPTPENPPWLTDLEGWQKRPKAERDEYRKEWSRKWTEAIKATYQPGWKVIPSKYFVVVSHTDAKYTKRITQAAEASYQWAEQKFGKISDDLVMPALLRIYDSRREESTYRNRELSRNPTEYDPEYREIYAFKDASTGNLGDGMGAIIRGVARHYIHDKHPLVLENLPRWVDAGLFGITDGARIPAGKKIIFFPTEDEIERFRKYEQKGEKQNVWWYTHEKAIETPKDGGKEDSFAYYWPECARLMRWLDEGGAKVLKHDDFLAVYLAEVGKTAMTFRPRPERDVEMDQVDDKKINDLRKLIYARRDEFLEKVNYAVMPFAQEAWAPIDKAWQDWNAEFAKRKFKKK